VGGGFKTQIIGRLGLEELAYLLQGVIDEHTLENSDGSRLMEQGNKRQIHFSSTGSRLAQIGLDISSERLTNVETPLKIAPDLTTLDHMVTWHRIID
jgi:hypothetical protein